MPIFDMGFPWDFTSQPCAMTPDDGFFVGPLGAPRRAKMLNKRNLELVGSWVSRGECYAGIEEYGNDL